MLVLMDLPGTVCPFRAWWAFGGLVANPNKLRGLGVG